MAEPVIPQDQLDEMLNIGEHPEGEGAKTGTPTTSSSGGGWMFYFGIGAVVLIAIFFFMMRTAKPKKT